MRNNVLVRAGLAHGNSASHTGTLGFGDARARFSHDGVMFVVTRAVDVEVTE